MREEKGERDDRTVRCPVRKDKLKSDKTSYDRNAKSWEH
jgi:hypothetical protein